MSRISLNVSVCVELYRGGSVGYSRTLGPTLRISVIAGFLGLIVPVEWQILSTLDRICCTGAYQSRGRIFTEILP